MKQIAQRLVSTPVSGCLQTPPQQPNAHDFIALLEAFRATGGAAPGDIMGSLLEEHQVGNVVSLAKLIYTGQVFGFEWSASLWIPMFQFAANDLALKAGAQSVRAQLPSMGSGWNVAAWFAAPNAQLDGRSPADSLDSDLAAVMRAAQSLESVDDFSLPPARRAQEVAVHV